MLHLQQIKIYPVKGLAGFSVQSSEIGARGLTYDRRWMLVDEDGLFLSQRTVPKMALLRARIEQGSLLIEGPDGALRIDEPMAPGHPRQAVRVWQDSLAALHVSSDGDVWFSRQLDRKCRLVYMDELCQRPIPSKYALSSSEVVSFADAMPILLTNAASLQRLSEAVGFSLAMDRFRPNLVISSMPAFAEVTWQQVRIGANFFRISKQCSRCPVTTLDPETGRKHGSGEPLKTLMVLNRDDRGRPAFGVYLIPETEGRISVGDQIEIIQKASQ